MFKTVTLNAAKYLPVLLRLFSAKPTNMVISVTNSCNCRCITCNYWKLDPVSEMSTEELKGVIRQAKDAGITSCLFYGGEPLLRGDIFELIGFAREAGLAARIITNGLLIDAEKARRLADSGLDYIGVSIYTCASTEDRLCGVKGAHEKVSVALQELMRLREKSRLNVTLAALIFLQTLREDRILDVVSLARQYKIPVDIQLLDLSLFYFKDAGEKGGEGLWITPEYYDQLDELADKLIRIKKNEPHLITNSIASLQYIKSYFRYPKNPDIPCYTAFSGRVWIDSQAKVYLCQGLAPIGDLRKESLKDIINSHSWKDGHRKMFQKRCPGCTCMYSSNVDAHMPLSWRQMLSGKFNTGNKYGQI